MNAPLTVTASGVYLRAEDDRRPAEPDPTQFGLLASGGGDRAARLGGQRAAARAGGLCQPRDVAPGRRHGDGGDGRDRARNCDGRVARDLGGDDLRRPRLPRTGERYVSYELVKGGFGARPVKDGINAVASTVSNMMNTPIEILEMSFPLRVEEYSLVPDSGGAGTWRGGLGVRRVWRVLGTTRRMPRCAASAR